MIEALVIVVAVGLIIMIGSFLVRSRQTSRGLSAADQAKIQNRWSEIELQMKKGGPSNFRQAVIEADKLVDYALQQLGVPGQTMGDRLKAANGRFSNINDVWSAHKVRNQLVHEIDRELLSFEVNKVIARFKRALTDLGVL